MKGAHAAAVGPGGSRERSPPSLREDPRTGLALGFIAMLPLFAAYEGALLALGGSRRNTGEILLCLSIEPLGPRSALARWALLSFAALLAWAVCRRRGVAVASGVSRIVLEGAAFAVLLGPLLGGGLALLGRWLPRLDVSWYPRSAPGLAEGALVFGGAAWEELLFRVGLYSLAFLLAAPAARALGMGSGRAAAEIAGALSSSLLFALLHSRPFLRWLGGGGEDFDPALFTWLVAAGILLAVLFRARGPGVAAWTHGLFNLALWIGIDPDVML